MATKSFDIHVDLIQRFGFLSTCILIVDLHFSTAVWVWMDVHSILANRFSTCCRHHLMLHCIYSHVSPVFHDFDVSYYMLMRLAHLYFNELHFHCISILDNYLAQDLELSLLFVIVDILASWHLDWWMRYIVRSLMLLRVTDVAFHMRNIDTCRDAHILKIVEVWSLFVWGETS